MLMFIKLPRKHTTHGAIYKAHGSTQPSRHVKFSFLAELNLSPYDSIAQLQSLEPALYDYESYTQTNQLCHQYWKH